MSFENPISGRASAQVQRKRRRSKSSPDDVVLPLIERLENPEFKPQTRRASRAEIAAALTAELQAAESAAAITGTMRRAIASRLAAAAPERSAASTAAAAAEPAANPPQWDGAAGSKTSNTDPASSQPAENLLIKGGIDTLEVGWEGTWEPAALLALFDRLETAKTDAIEGRAASGVLTGPDGETIGVRLRGFMRGPYHFAYAVETRGVVIAFRDQATPDGFSQVHCRVSSLTLMASGVRRAVHEVRELLGKLGFSSKPEDGGKEQVAAAHMCIDIPNVSPAELVKRCMSRARIAVPRKFTYHEDNDGFTGFTCGKNIKLRVYDKSQELRDKPDADKQAVLEKTRWGGPCETSTRVEFDTGREELRELWNVGDLEDLLAKLPIMVDYMTNEWFRLTEEVVSEEDRKNKHQARYKTADVWQRVADQFQEVYASVTDPATLDWMRSVMPIEPTRILRQGVGCLAAVAATMRMKLDTMLHARLFFEEVFTRHGVAFLESFREKAREACVKHPLGVGDVPWGPALIGGVADRGPPGVPF